MLGKNVKEFLSKIWRSSKKKKILEKLLKILIKNYKNLKF